MQTVERRFDAVCHVPRLSLFFLLCVFIAFLEAGIYTSNRQSNNNNQPEWTSYSHFERKTNIIHPLSQLMDSAEARFRKKLNSQSRTLKEAVTEYRRRYKRHPPQGFDDWWEFARKHNVLLVDEYDGLMKDLAPFYELSGAEFRRRVQRAAALPLVDLVRIRNGTSSAVNLKGGFESSEVSGRANGFRGMMEKFVSKLPDMDLPINAKAENRVVVPWEDKHPRNINGTSDSPKKDEHLVDWQGSGNVWEVWRRACSPDSAARRLFYSLRDPFSQSPKDYLVQEGDNLGRDFAFASETSMNLDFCKKPHARYGQGLFFSDLRTISSLYPILSPAKAPGFADIKIPSHYYYGSTKRYTYGWDSVNLELKDMDDMDVPWEQKKDMIFWRGASTGGGSNPAGFSPQYQRHRFLRMASSNSTVNRTVTFVDPLERNGYLSVLVPVSNLNTEVMDVAFAKAVDVHAYPGGGDSLRSQHRFEDSVALGGHWGYKYLIDLDGMGYSARFFAFLASDSVPIKSTVYEEFYSDWIQPWVHFIPLSPTYKEIYNIHAFFSGPTRSTLELANLTQHAAYPYNDTFSEGDTRLRRIARAGKQWQRTVGRTVDMEAYVYRLCLEYARLWDYDRSSVSLS